MKKTQRRKNITSTSLRRSPGIFLSLTSARGVREVSRMPKSTGGTATGTTCPLMTTHGLFCVISVKPLSAPPPKNSPLTEKLIVKSTNVMMLGANSLTFVLCVFRVSGLMDTKICCPIIENCIQTLCLVAKKCFVQHVA